MYTREQTATRAEAARTNDVGMCAQWSRTMAGAAAIGDRDGDKDADAVDFIKAAKELHRGDHNPPRGVIALFDGGRLGHGHAAVALGGSRIRTIDMNGGIYTPGRVGTASVDQIERVLGVRYVGWTPDVGGQRILDNPKEKPVSKDIILEVDVASANLMENPRHDGTIAADLEKIQASGADIVLYQEASNKVYRTAMGHLTRLRYKAARSGTNFDVPVGFDPTILTPTKSTAQKIQSGWAGVTPDRFLANIRFAVESVNGVSFVVRNAHPIAGAFTPDGGLGRKGATVKKRQAMWRKSRRIIAARVRAAAIAGTPQIVGGDFNRKKIGLKFGAVIQGRKVQKVHNGFDFIYFIDGKKYGWSLVGDLRVIDTHSDHNLIVQRARLIRK